MGHQKERNLGLVDIAETKCNQFPRVFFPRGKYFPASLMRPSIFPILDKKPVYQCYPRCRTIKNPSQNDFRRRIDDSGKGSSANCFAGNRRWKMDGAGLRETFEGREEMRLRFVVDRSRINGAWITSTGNSGKALRRRIWRVPLVMVKCNDDQNYACSWNTF